MGVKVTVAMVVGLVAKKVWLGMRWIGESLLGVAAANWRPGVAYFALSTVYPEKLNR